MCQQISLEYQREALKKEIFEYKEKITFRFYITLTGYPQKLIGIIGLNNIVWGAFQSAFLGYKLDERFINKGYMSMAVKLLVSYAFEELHLHRIEANVMPKNKASQSII